MWGAPPSPTGGRARSRDSAEGLNRRPATALWQLNRWSAPTMGILSTIWDKITGRKRDRENDDAAPTPRPTAPTAPTTTPLEPVDVEAVLSRLAEQRGGGGNWRTSIVDLLKLLDMDSSLAARTELAEELNVHAGLHGSAEQNIALSKAVWRALERNGGRVPAALRD